ncbi:MAG TPA: hypothetical protein VJ813_16445, partial [Vicinamibacterales bacterium]|nr:hypothetical protein [Vicinamibacterales bacterium]
AASVDQLRRVMAAAEAARVGRKELAAAGRASADAQAAVQKARAAIGSEDYLSARDGVKDIPRRIMAEIVALDAAAAKRPARPPRRGR